jgi:phosphate transport system substrate-binding protein
MGDFLVGDYRLIARLGRGGMADVFLAVREGLVGFSKLVVVKRLRQDLAEHAQGRRYRTLLLDEARLASRLAHPNVVQTFEVGEHGGVPFMAMEYLDGQPLHRVLMAARRAGTEVPLGAALRVVVDVLAALEYAHQLADFDGTPLRIVHRDVSPQNVFWTYDGDIKLVDFGVAKFSLGRDETEAGVVKGKAGYMAPEQTRGGAVDARTDVFATGILLWELLTGGRRLLRARTPAEAVQRLLFDPLPPPTAYRPQLDPELARICMRALEREPARRYPSARAMREELERAQPAGAPGRAELAALIAPLFESERRVISDQIRAAMLGEETSIITIEQPPTTRSSIGRLGSEELLTTPPPRPAATAAGTSEALPVVEAEPERGGPPPARPPTGAGLGPRARAIAGLSAAIAATLIAIAGVAAWRTSGDDAEAPAAAEARARSAAAPATGPAPAASAPPGGAPRPSALRLCGSNTIGAELGPALVEAFLRRKGVTAVQRARGVRATDVEIVGQLSGQPIAVTVAAAGTSTAFEGLAAGTCDVGMASRAVTETEVAALARAGVQDVRAPGTEHVLALDGIAVIVHPNNPLRALDRDALRAVFTGQITNWGAIGGAPGPITVLARDAHSGTFDTFKHLVLGKVELAAGARRFEQSDGLADQVASDPAAIGFVGLAYVRSAKALAVGEPGAPAMLPTSFTVTTEGYMLSRRLYLYTAPRPRSPLIADFVSFALSAAGQEAVRTAGFVDLELVVSDPPPCDERCPARYAALVRGAHRLSLDLRFRHGSDRTDSRATRDLDRLVHFLQRHPGNQVLLLGFSDSSGDPAQNVRLSRERARVIATELAARGVRAAAVDGFGAARPVSGNRTESDRERNRRVEVWLRAPP